MAIRAGDTFLLTQATGSKPHLWVLLWGPAGAANAFLGVFLTTLRPFSDRTCVLAVGDHPFVKHDTSVNFGAATRWTEETLNQLMRRGAGHPREPVSPELLERMRTGFLASPRTPHAMIQMAREDFGA